MGAVGGWAQMVGMVDPTNLDVTTIRMFDVSNIAGVAVRQISTEIGSSTVDSIRDRIMTAFDGKLPPEALDALRKGPREFEKYVSRMQEYMPGKKIDELKNILLNRPLFKIPTTAYAAILSANAARHYASAFQGVTVNLNELKRAVEVTKVMVWQVREKEGVNVDIMDIANFARDFGRLIGAGEFVGRVEGEIAGRLERIEELTRRLDEMILDRVADIRSRIGGVVGEIQSELTAIQESFVSPVRDIINDVAGDVQMGIDEFRGSVVDALPNVSGGIPEAFEGVGLPENFGDSRPIDLLDGLGDRLAEGVAGAAVSIADSFGKLGPLAQILDVEKIPANDESISRELDPVLMHNGEFIYEITDFVIPGRGLDIKFARIYRARSLFPGELGWRWTHSYAERLLPSNDGRSDGLTHINDKGRKFFFRSKGDLFESPVKIESTLTKKIDGYEMKRPDGHVTIFDSDGRMSSQRDSFGNQIVFEYTGDGLLSTIVDVLGRKIKINRGSNGMIDEIVDFVGRRFRYEYDERANLIGAISPATGDHPNGRTTAYRYTDDSNPAKDHLLKMAMDPRGNVFLRNEYDDEGRIVGQRVGDGKWMDVEYSLDDEGRMNAFVIDSMGAMHLYKHDREGHFITEDQASENKRSLHKKHLGDGSVEKRQYNGFGQIVSEIGRDGVRVNYEYHPYYDPDGDGVVLLKEFDPNVSDGGYLKSIDVGGKRRSFVYDPIGNIVRTIHADGKIVKFDVDNVNRVIGEKTSGSNYIDYAFDENDNLIAIISEDGRIEYSYDKMDRLLSAKLVDGLNIMSLNYGYDALGRPVQGYDGKGERVSFEYDSQGRLISEERSDGKKIGWSYGTDGYLAGINRNGLVNTIKRNGFGEVIAVVAPDGGTKRFIRDGSGHLMASIDFDGKSDFSVRDGLLDNFGEQAVYPDFTHLSFHRGQGGSSSASMPNRPLTVSRDYDVNPFDRTVVSSMVFPANRPRVLPKLSCLRFESKTVDAMRREVIRESISGGSQ